MSHRAHWNGVIAERWAWLEAWPGPPRSNNSLRRTSKVLFSFLRDFSVFRSSDPRFSHKFFHEKLIPLSKGNHKNIIVHLKLFAAANEIIMRSLRLFRTTKALLDNCSMTLLQILQEHFISLRIDFDLLLFFCYFFLSFAHTFHTWTWLWFVRETGAFVHNRISSIE